MILIYMMGNDIYDLLMKKIDDMREINFSKIYICIKGKIF